MITGKLIAGHVVRHKRTGGLYTVEHPEAQVKIDSIVDWSPCVVYKQHGTGAIFVRNTGAFRHNFELVTVQ